MAIDYAVATSMYKIMLANNTIMIFASQEIYL